MLLFQLNVLLAGWWRLHPTKSPSGENVALLVCEAIEEATVQQSAIVGDFNLPKPVWNSMEIYSGLSSQLVQDMSATFDLYKCNSVMREV